MKQLEFHTKVEDGKVVIALPENFNNREVSVTITTEDDFKDDDYFGKEEDWARLPSYKKVQLLKRFTGTAKYPNAETNKYDVYDQ